jgi:hypothetical protein
VLSREYAVIREGELELTDLWLEMCVRRELAQSGGKDTPALREQLIERYPPPINIDFRMIAQK